MSAEQDYASVYEAWYHTPRGRWIAAQETALLLKLMVPHRGDTLLDVGCGTGHFSRRFVAEGLHVTGLDPDSVMLDFARRQHGAVDYLLGTSLALPFADASFDHVTAVTSLCFIADPAAALAEMWRVARRSVCLGLLNRHSLLHRRKAGRGAYRGARWDDVATVRCWIDTLIPAPHVITRGAIFFPGGNPFTRRLETILPASLPWGGFLAVHLHKPVVLDSDQASLRRKMHTDPQWNHSTIEQSAEESIMEHCGMR